MYVLRRCRELYFGPRRRSGGILHHAQVCIRLYSFRIEGLSGSKSILQRRGRRRAGASSSQRASQDLFAPGKTSWLVNTLLQLQKPEPLDVHRGTKSVGIFRRRACRKDAIVEQPNAFSVRIVVYQSTIVPPSCFDPLEMFPGSSRRCASGLKVFIIN